MNFEIWVFMSMFAVYTNANKDLDFLGSYYVQSTTGPELQCVWLNCRITAGKNKCDKIQIDKNGVETKDVKHLEHDQKTGKLYVTDTKGATEPPGSTLTVEEWNGVRKLSFTDGQGKHVFLECLTKTEKPKEGQMKTLGEKCHDAGMRPTINSRNKCKK